jgi:hypothetical protein
MSSVIVVTPLIIAGWPVLTAAVTAAVSSMGFSVLTANSGQAQKQPGMNRAEIEVEDSEILAEAAPSEQLVVERAGVRAIFSRDARGALKLCMEGEALSKSELKKLGQELIGRVTQQYVYHRIVTELKERNMTIVDEQVSADRTVTLRVRNL